MQIGTAKAEQNKMSYGFMDRMKLKFNHFTLYLMIIPAFTLLFLFKYIPMYGVIMAFQDYQPFTGFLHSTWVGWEHFIYMFSAPDTVEVFRNTLLISFYRLFFGFPVPIMFALLLNEVRINWFKRTVQTMVYLPHFLSWVIIGKILIDLLSPSTGLVNQVIQTLGFDSIFFLGSNDWFRTTLVTSDVWKEFGFGAIIYLAALAGINPSLYESAVIDGAGKWKQMWYITLPSILPVIVVMMVLNLGNILEAGFEQVFVMYNPAVYETGDIIDTYVYRTGLLGFQYSLGAAVGLLKSIVGFVMIVIGYILAYRYANYRIW